MALLRRNQDGYVRYALSIQYHGASFLGFTDQGDQEDCILPNGTDLRGYRSVESRLKEALGNLFDYKNIQVSSRTDRGVHALKNTLHVDVRSRSTTTDNNQCPLLTLQRGLNFHLARQKNWWKKENGGKTGKGRSSQISPYTVIGDEWRRHSLDELRVLSAKRAPESMHNPFSEQDPSQPSTVEWNARFSATERTYVYRMLWFSDRDNVWGVPFEWDRSWRIRKHDDCSSSINLRGMQKAATFLEGTHDFSSFRTAGCQRQSPIVTIKSIHIHVEPYGIPGLWGHGSGLLGLGGDDYAEQSSPQLVTVRIVGDSFLYRQVRNMVACLAEVGKNKLKPSDVQEILEARDRSAAPGMAPAHGLFLVDVQHGDFVI